MKSKVRNVSDTEEKTVANLDVIYEDGNSVYQCKIIDNESKNEDSKTENCGYLIELNSLKSAQYFFNRILKIE